MGGTVTSPPPPDALADGLYAVVRDRPDGRPGICAGVLVAAGEVVECAPILRRRIDYWLRSGYLRRVSD